MAGIPRLSFAKLAAGDGEETARLKEAAEGIGFLTLFDTPIAPASVEALIDAYRAFFRQEPDLKDRWNMARTGSTRGWGAPLAERVDPEANPDYKEFFDVGHEPPPDDPVAKLELPTYAPNIWPDAPEGFAEAVRAYFGEACGVALDLLAAIAGAIGERRDYFTDKFDRPMAILRGNYYPPRPAWTGEKDFGIAAHTDYGCLTLLATDGRPGLEVKGLDGSWIGVAVPPGEFVINFGEMLEMWSGRRVAATPHRVVGGSDERISIPLFFNPNHDANVAPEGAAPVMAEEHLSKRFNETYVHLGEKA